MAVDWNVPAARLNRLPGYLAWAGVGLSLWGEIHMESVMPAKITLRITQGKLTGQEIVFDDRTTCIMGRASDCSPRLPDDEEHRTIGRHHCLLDINPPDIRIRDFGKSEWYVHQWNADRPT